MTFGELFVALGFKVDDKDLRKVQSNMDNAKKSALGFKIAIAGMTYAIGRMFNQTIKGNAELERFIQTTGLSIEKLQQWQESGQKIDLTLDKNAIASSIANLQKNLNEIKLGGGNISAFQILGIDIAGKDAFQVLEDLRTKLQGMDTPMARNLIERTGLDASFVGLLKVSRQEFEKLGKQIQLTGMQRQGLSALGKSVKQMQLNFTAFKNQLSASLAPALTKFFESLNSFFSKNGEQIVSITKSIGATFEKFTLILTRVGGLVIDVLEPVFDALKNMLGLENTLVLFGLALAKAFSPFTIALGGVLLLLEDLAVWFKGGDSLFGGVYDFVAELTKSLTPLLNLIKEIFDIPEKINASSVQIKETQTKVNIEKKEEGKESPNIFSQSTKQDNLNPEIVKENQGETGGDVAKRYGKSIGAGAVGGSIVGMPYLGAFVGFVKEFTQDLKFAKEQVNAIQAPMLQQRINEYRETKQVELRQTNDFSITIQSENPTKVGEEIMNSDQFSKALNAIGSQYQNSTII